MVVIGFLSAMVSTACHAVTCNKSDADRTAGAIPWAMTSSPYDDYAPCTNGFPHRQCAHGYCGMCRFERRRERRYERRAERDLDFRHSCRSTRRGRCPCGVSGGSFVVLPPSAVPTSDPDWNTRRMAVPHYQQEQGVQSAESLTTVPSVPVERSTIASPPAYAAYEKPERFFQ
ncbi:hypothetical protein F5X68DRAFT_231364 [Plectosphaerella plurivora]|uniref:Secreted protein n=1 Tax=Plectosphaerella plurivora TaxID=936078 RepID=A0A9P8VBP4_9PEZI|nr:hypothetical protein F5X68DRAFT_231364 [Plectosphaerella plurivora]